MGAAIDIRDTAFQLEHATDTIRFLTLGPL
jgi:hypothetical protein